MKNVLVKTLAVAGLLLAGSAQASMINLNVDSGPNMFGSPDWNTWFADSKTDIAGGSFDNMRSSNDPANAGTLNYDPTDAVVYSFGDLGNRMHFFYWIEDTSLDEIGQSLEVSFHYEWDSVWYDFYDEYYGSTWINPSRSEDYADGVIGHVGLAWWGAYNVNTQQALDADLEEWAPLMGDMKVCVRLDGGKTAENCISVSNAAAVPEPSTFALFSLVLGAMGVRRLSRK